MQTLKGSFVLKLIGVPIAYFAALNLITEKGSAAWGRGIAIGPFLFAVVTPGKFKRARS